MKNLIIILSMLFMSNVNAEIGESMDSMSSFGMNSKPYAFHVAYENYTPKERVNFNLQGVNIGIQWSDEYEESQFVMVMGPNLSVLNEEKAGAEEDIVLLKWDQGLSYIFDFGDNVQLRPNVVAGVGYGWLNSDRPNGLSQSNENAPLLEFIAGLDFKPGSDVNMYAKGGYRYFEVDKAGAGVSGQLEGSFAMLGLGFNY